MREINLTVDGTKIGFGHQLKIVCMTYRKRAIPIAWTWVKYVHGHSSIWKQLALLAYVRMLIPKDAAVFLVGNSEFGAVAVLRQLDRWQWFYILRQKTDTKVWLDEHPGWRSFGSYVHKPGQSIWLGRGSLTAQKIYSTNRQGRPCLLTCWSIGVLVREIPGAWPPIYRIDR